MSERWISSMFLFTFGVVAFAGCAVNSTEEEGGDPAESEVTEDAVTGEKAYSPGSGWTLKWQDNFEGTSLNSANWNVLTSNWDPVTNNCNFGTGELEFPRAANVKVSGGKLVIKAERASGSPTDSHCAGQGRSFYSGRITTRGKVEKTYGKIVASIKVPSGFGMWPAFWTLGGNISQVGWPASGEIDILEWDSRAASWMKSATHWKGGDWGTGADRGSSLADSFHVYEVEWNANTMTFRLDGNVVANQSFPAGSDAGRSAAFHHNHYIILNLAIGGAWYGNPAPSAIALPAGSSKTMEVQWVRWYQK